MQREAMNGLSGKKAIFEELDLFLDKGVFKIKKYQTNYQLRWHSSIHIGFSLVLPKKLDKKGYIKWFKARCIAWVFKQKEGIDYQETFLPTGRLIILRFSINYTVQKEAKIRQANIFMAYLNSELAEEETIYTELPEDLNRIHHQDKTRTI